ncbi:helix-turn-helix transcriptional regulator [Lutibacter maritimus]|uniref:Transcriptional regulator, AraC family n=1 Tax=Lutibacter maritimus TaxID=593133 RepID=A0A1I6R6S0_9FLAO|nr:AraC family transcriptional regulator [Lutibacter maritimus]SFS60228.1 transcriptional regulator, AraC family [Lutibacter maritimus]
MNKKRRDYKNCEILYVAQSDEEVFQTLAIEMERKNDPFFQFNKQVLLPKYGNGCVLSFCFDDVILSICRFKLTKDLIIHYNNDDDYTQLTFVVDGEKIISSTKFKNDILLESQDSYIANTNNFKGTVRISGLKPFKEIRIKLPSTFLNKHGITNELNFKKIVETDRTQPITNDLFSILINLESSRLNGISKKIFMEAKVLELLAIQMGNIDTICFNKYRTCMGSIKKVYAVERFIKENLSENYSVKNLSNEVGLNEKVLKIEFKRIFGVTMSEYAKKVKMEKSEVLLINTQLTIYEISDAIGYKNATHFSAAFKKYFGETPMQFRNKLK